MSKWTEVRDSVRSGLSSMWDGFTPVMRASLIAFTLGVVLGAVIF